MPVKKIVLVFLFLTFALVQARDLNTEFRTAWVITWEHISAGKTADENKTRVRQILDNMRKAHMNAVIWQVRQGGTSYYRSELEPWGYYAGYRDPGYDPLAYVVQQAHIRGMEVHAWFNAFNTSDGVTGAPAQAHPEWVCRNSDNQPMTSSRALSPGLKQVRDYTIRVAMDIVRRYDLDGLHLDYVRWNEETGLTKLQKSVPDYAQWDGVPPEAPLTENLASRFLYDVEHPYSGGVPNGYANWEEWWRWSVSEFVRTLHDSVQAVKPWVRLSAAVLGNYNWGGWQGYGSVYQDAALWFNKGYVDQLMPMHYGWYSGNEFLARLVNGCPDCWSQYIQEGIAKGRLFSAGPGSYLFSSSAFYSTHQQIVNACRQVPWVDGFQFFSYGTWEDNELFVRAGETFFAEQAKQRAAKFLYDALPSAPALTLAKTDSLRYTVNVQPPADALQDQWYVLYRTPAGAGDSAAKIIDIHFGHEPFQYNETFTGTQDFNGCYRYHATHCDRFWNESPASSAILGDMIPSFAPTIADCLPVAGDTIDARSSVQVRFTKTMDITSFYNAVSVQPSTAMGSLQWSLDRRTCTITASHGFTYGQSYTLTISAEVKDSNGRQLDADGDGVPGDAFSRQFYIIARDTAGPRVLSLYPAPGAEIMPEEIISVVLDEPPAAATLTENAIILKKGTSVVPCLWSVTRLPGQCVLSVKAKTVLETNSSYQLTVTTAVTDTLANPLTDPVVLDFKTGARRVKDTRTIDQFTSVGNWKAPTYSGSTVGVRSLSCTFDISKNAYLPAGVPAQRNSAALQYEWDAAASAFLLREYMDVASAGAAVKFDSSWTLQCYVFGDGGNVKFRFAVDDGSQHEVSQWITVDWSGWRLVEWPLNNPAFFGSWLGNGVFSSASLNIDSIQLTRDEQSGWSGVLYLDELRAVKKIDVPTVVQTAGVPVPDEFVLEQNFPNPFNAETVISFSLPEKGNIRLTVFDMLGREIAVLAQGVFAAGRHAVRWQSRGTPSGAYLYVLKTSAQQQVRRLMIVR